MSDQKRKANETDPDYDDVVDQQAKRQRVLEQDGRQAACKTINSIIKKEFQKEIFDKEKSLQQIDLRLNEARLMMDRLRACVVASYYGRANRTLSSVPSTSNFSSIKAPPPNIHPAVKKYIGKAPKNEQTTISPLSQEVESQNQDCEISGQMTAQNVSEISTKVIARLADVSRDPISTSSSPLSFTSLKSSKLPMVSAQYDDRRLRFKIKKKIVIGNISRYIPVDQRESTDMSSHKWMVYVRGPKSEPNISRFVKKVWFFLHHSYKPNDHVEISGPPFHLTRRGWGEFPVRVQLHFVDPRNKKVDIIHHLKLDKTFTGLQKLGAETVVEVELERDFFESDDDSPALPTGPPHLFIPSQALSSLSSSKQTSSASSSLLPKHPQGVIAPLLKSSSSAFQNPQTINTPLPSPSSSQSPSFLLNETRKSNPDSIFDRNEGRCCVDNSMSYETVDEDGQCETVDGDGPWEEVKRIDTRTKKVVRRKGANTKMDESKNDKNSINSVDKVDELWVKIELEEEEIIVETAYNDNVLTEDLKPNGVCERLSIERVDSHMEDDYHVTIEHEEMEGRGDVTGGKLSDKTGGVDSMDQEGNNEMRVSIEDMTQVADNVVVDYEEDWTNVAIHGEELGFKLPTSSPWLPSGQIYTSFSNNALPATSDLPSLTDDRKILAFEESNHQPVSKQNRSFSLLTSSTLEKVRQQKQTQQHIVQVNPPLPQHVISNQVTRKISTLQPGAVQQKTAVSTSQSISNTTGIQQFTVINIADLHKKKSISPATSNTPPKSTGASVTLGSNSSKMSAMLPQSKSLLAHTGNSSELLSQNLDIDSPQPEQKQPQYIVRLPQGTILRHKDTPQKSLLAGQHLVKGKQDNAISLLQSNPCDTQSGQKIIYLNAPSSSYQNNPISSPTVIPPSVTSNKKQVSLLTGLVVKNQSTNQNAGNPLTSNQISSPVVSMSSHQAIPNSVQNVNSSQKLPNDQGVIILSRANTTKTSSPFSLLTPPTSVSSLTPSTSLSSSISMTPNAVLAQTSSPNIVIAYPNTFVKTGNISSNVLDSMDICRETEIKMSVIGKTKRGQQQRLIKPPDSVIASFSSLGTAEERIRKQYEVLNAWKNNLIVKKVSNVNDVIDGDVDVIPKLNVEDYPDLISVVKASLKLHPLIQTGVDRTTHPYCAESLDQWSSWPVGKQRAAEWHRACFTLKHVKACLHGAVSFKGENLFKTRQLVQWCRLHAFSPQGPVAEPQELVVKEELSMSFDTNNEPGCSLPWSNEIPQSLTKLADLNSHLSGLLQPVIAVSDSDEIEIVLKEPVKERFCVKEEVLSEGDKSRSAWPPESDGASFVYDWMRKRGIKFLSENLEENVAADMLFRAMMEFASDVLRKSFSVYSHKDRSTDTLCVQDVHAALSSFPAAAFCCNTYLGKEEEDNSGGSAAR